MLFYCHFPDLLQAEVGTALHRAYRRPLDWAEEASTGAADTIVVNSRFTRGGLAPVRAQADSELALSRPLSEDLVKPVLHHHQWRSSSLGSSDCPYE